MKLIQKHYVFSRPKLIKKGLYQNRKSVITNVTVVFLKWFYRILLLCHRWTQNFTVIFVTIMHLGSISAEKHMQVLDRLLPSRLCLVQWWHCVFQQDCVKPHTCTVTWLWSHSSPEISPTEHFWCVMKQNKNEWAKKTQDFWADDHHKTKRRSPPKTPAAGVLRHLQEEEMMLHRGTIYPALTFVRCFAADIKFKMTRLTCLLWAIVNKSGLVNQEVCLVAQFLHNNGPEQLTSICLQLSFTHR